MVAAAPGITDEQKAAITADIEKMATSDGVEEGAGRPRLDRQLRAGDAFQAQLASDIDATSGDPERHRPRAVSRGPAVSGPAAPRRPDRAAFVIAVLLAVLAAVIFCETRAMKVTAAYARVGPTTFPYVIAAGLAVLAVGTALSAWRGGFPEREPERLGPILWIVGGLVAAAPAPEAGRLLDRHRPPLRPDRARLRPRPALAHHPDRHRLRARRLAGLRAAAHALAAGGPARAPHSLTEDAWTPSASSLHGLGLALQPMNLLYALIGVTLGTAVGVLPGHRPGADRRAPPAGHLPARPDRLAHHVRRHLLRRHVWRLDHLDPPQHPRRERLDRHRARGQQDGPRRPRRPGARHRRHRLLRRRAHRHPRRSPSSRPGW